AASALLTAGSWAASTSPPVAAMPLISPRRLTFLIANLRWVLSSVRSGPLGSGANGRVDALIATAATEIAGHAGGNLIVGRRRLLRQQRRRLHDLPSLTIAALRHADLAPGNLDPMLVLGMQALDGGNGLAGNFRHLHHARAGRRAINVHGAGAAQANPAPELGAGHGQFITQVPQERHRRVTVVGALLSIHP